MNLTLMEFTKGWC